MSHMENNKSNFDASIADISKENIKNTENHMLLADKSNAYQLLMLKNYKKIENEEKNSTKILKNSDSMNSNKRIKKNNFLQIKNSPVRSSNNNISLIKSVVDEHGSLKYDEFVRKFNEKNRYLDKRDIIIDSDPVDSSSDEEKNDKFVILPDHPFKFYWDILVSVLLIYSAIISPYSISFIEDEDSVDSVFNKIDYFIDISFTLDCLLNFFFAFRDQEDNLVISQKKIIYNYLKLWFWIDLSTIIPFNYFMENNSQSTDSSLNPNVNRRGKINSLGRIIRLPKLYRLIRMTKFLKKTSANNDKSKSGMAKYFQEKLKLKANLERLLYFLLGFLVLTHISACMWYFIAKLDNFSPDSWVTRLGYLDHSYYDLYIIAIYWTLTTVTTVGYGDVSAYTTAEKVYNLFIMSFGVIMYSFAIGSLTTIVTNLDAKTAEVNQKLQILSSLRAEFRIDKEIYEKVRKVIKFDMWKMQTDNNHFLQLLPSKLRTELSQIIHDNVIKKFLFFQNKNKEFIATVSQLLKPIRLKQNEILYNIMEVIDEMYFVSRGSVIFVLNLEEGEREIKEIKKNSNFGEIEMCLNEELSYGIKVKSRTCELFTLKKNDFLKLSVNYKDIIEKFLKKSLMVYLRYNDEIKKIMSEEEQKHKNILNITENNNEALVENLKSITHKKSLGKLNQNKSSWDNDIEGNPTENDKNLEKISEKSYEEKAGSSEEYNVYDHINYSDDCIFNDKSPKGIRGKRKLESNFKRKINLQISDNHVENVKKMKDIDNEEIIFSDSERTFNNEMHKSNEKLNLYENKTNADQLDAEIGIEEKPLKEEVICASSITRRVNKEREEIELIFNKSRNNSPKKDNRYYESPQNRNKLNKKQLDNENYLKTELLSAAPKKDLKTEKRKKSVIFADDNNSLNKIEKDDNCMNESKDNLIITNTKKHSKKKPIKKVNSANPNTFERKLSKIRRLSFTRGLKYDKVLNRMSAMSLKSNNQRKSNLKYSQSSDEDDDHINKKEEIKGKNKKQNSLRTKSHLNKDENDLDEFIKGYRKQLNNKFNSHMEQAIMFFDSLAIKYEYLGQEENPIYLLSKLTQIENCFERNEIIEKIEIIVNNV